jgi:Spy/CpxP family protein refolding chaperone
MKQLIKRNLGFAFTLLVLLVGSSVYAQPSGGQQGPASVPNSKQIKKIVADVSKELSLTDEQESKISEMYATHFDEVKEATSSGKPDRNEMEAMKTEFEKEVKSVLTEEQQKLFTAYLKKQNQQTGGGRGPNR